MSQAHVNGCQLLPTAVVVGGAWVVHVLLGNETHHCGSRTAASQNPSSSQCVGHWLRGCAVGLRQRGPVPPAAPLRPQKGHDSVVQLLLSAGAAKDAICEKGWTPLHDASYVCVC